MGACELDSDRCFPTTTIDTGNGDSKTSVVTYSPCAVVLLHDLKSGALRLNRMVKWMSNYKIYI